MISGRGVARVGIVAWSLTACTGGGETSDSDAAAADVDMTAADFPCLTTMESTGRNRFANLLGNLDGTRAIATSPDGGSFPVGTLIQLVPTEAMVKRRAGWNAANNDWEFFKLDVTGGVTTIVARGGADVSNNAGSCFSCHSAAAPQWDLVCGADHGCQPLGLTQELIQAVQSADPRCN